MDGLIHLVEILQNCLRPSNPEMISKHSLMLKVGTGSVIVIKFCIHGVPVACEDYIDTMAATYISRDDVNNIYCTLGIHVHL